MIRKSPPSERFLNVIHRQSIAKRDACYWLGFLEGVAASGSIESGELEPLLAHSEKFLSEFDDDDARDLVEDLTLSWPDQSAEAYSMVQDIVEVRLAELDMDTGYNLTNRFLGFLKGVACDGHVFKSEVEAILGFLAIHPKLLGDARVENVRRVAARTLEDGVITLDESDELCGWIARLVGDSFADTGVSTPQDIGASELFTYSIDINDLKEATVVMTGEFLRIGLTRPQIRVYLEKMGARCVEGVSKKVDILFVAQEASKYWATPNAGTKLIKAHQLRSKGEKPTLVSELALLKILKD